MTKPKMEEGSKLTSEGGVINKFDTEIRLGEYDWLYIEDQDGGVSVKKEDAIRALYEGGPLRPLWDAAVQVRNGFESGDADDLLNAARYLSHVIDDMKEPTP